MPDNPPVTDALSTALQQLLGPLARLAVARGVTHAVLDEWLKQALVQAADQQHQALPPHRRVSRITTATGIHRREVSRLVNLLREGSEREAAPAQRSHAHQLFHLWRTRREFCDLNGSSAELPRVGSGASFETLAQHVTRDVHPRSLLDELLRLGMAAFDRERDTVRLVRETFVPQGDEVQMVRVLGRNVGSHLEAAVDNVLSDNHRHHEQAIFADGLSEASVVEFRRLVRVQWQRLFDAMVPELEALVARDQAVADSDPALAPPQHQVRVGLYSHDTEPAARPAAAGTDSSPSPATSPDAPPP